MRYATNTNFSAYMRYTSYMSVCSTAELVEQL